MPTLPVYIHDVGWLLLFFYVLPCGYRWFVYRFYRAFAKHAHFYQLKSYRRRYGYCFIFFLAGLYLVLWRVFKGDLPLLNHANSYLLLAGAFLVLISSIDFKLHLIPLSLLLGFAVCTLLYQYQMYPLFVLFSMEKCWVLVFLLVCFIGCRRGIGLADFYFMLIIGIVLSLELWLWMLLGATLCGICYGAMLRLRGYLAQGFAFGPWLSLNTWLIFLLTT